MEIEGVLELHVAGVKPEEQVKVGVVKEPQRDNDTGLQVVIKELAERLGNLEAKIQSVELRSDGACRSKILGTETPRCWTKAAVSFNQ